VTITHRFLADFKTKWIPQNSVDNGLIEGLLRNLAALREVKDNSQWKAQLEFDLPTIPTPRA